MHRGGIATSIQMFRRLVQCIKARICRWKGLKCTEEAPKEDVAKLVY